jgi:small subunit ribosomal protein S4e
MLDKLSGVFAPRPSTGPHKLRECLPVMILLRNRLKYALTKRECTQILFERLLQVDGKVRTDPTYPAGFMDVVQIEKTNENFRLLFDTKGRFFIQPVSEQEAAYKLCKVKRNVLGHKGVPQVGTHDGRTIRYPDPLIKVHDTVKVDIKTGKITDFIKFDVGNLVMCTGGANTGRVGVVVHKERHPGSFDIVHVKDKADNQFATRVSNVFVIGKGNKSWVTLPPRKGVRLDIITDRDLKAKKMAKNKQ